MSELSAARIREKLRDWKPTFPSPPLTDEDIKGLYRLALLLSEESLRHTDAHHDQYYMASMGLAQAMTEIERLRAVEAAAKEEIAACPSCQAMKTYGRTVSCAWHERITTAIQRGEGDG